MEHSSWEEWGEYENISLHNTFQVRLHSFEFEIELQFTSMILTRLVACAYGVNLTLMLAKDTIQSGTGEDQLSQ